MTKTSLANRCVASVFGIASGSIISVRVFDLNADFANGMTVGAVVIAVFLWRHLRGAEEPGE